MIDTHQDEIAILAIDDAAAATAALVEGPPHRTVIVAGRPGRFAYMYRRPGGGGWISSEPVAVEDIEAYDAAARKANLFGAYL